MDPMTKLSDEELKAALEESLIEIKEEIAAKQKEMFKVIKLYKKLYGLNIK